MFLAIIPSIMASAHKVRPLGRESSRPVLFGGIAYIPILFLGFSILGKALEAQGLAVSVVWPRESRLLTYDFLPRLGIGRMNGREK